MERHDDRYRPHRPPTIRRSPRSGTRTAGGCSISPFACCWTSATPRTWCRRRSPAWPARTSPASTIPKAGSSSSPAGCASTGSARGAAARPMRSTSLDDPFDPHAARPVESGHPRRQRHVGDACAARTPEPGGADLVRAPRRVPVLLRRRRRRSSGEARRPAGNWPAGPAGPCRPSRRPAGSRSTPRCSDRSASDSSTRAPAVTSRASWRCSTRPSTAPATSFPVWRSGAADVAPGILRYLGPPASPTLLHLPVGDRVGIVALRDHRVLALVVLTIDERARRPRRRVGGRGPARRSERSPRLALTSALVRSADPRDDPCAVDGGAARRGRTTRLLRALPRRSSADRAAR